MSVLEVNETCLLPSPPTNTFPPVTLRVKDLHHSELDTEGETLVSKWLTVPKGCQHMVQCQREHTGCLRPSAGLELWPLQRVLLPLRSQQVVRIQRG